MYRREKTLRYKVGISKYCPPLVSELPTKFFAFVRTGQNSTLAADTKSGILLGSDGETRSRPGGPRDCARRDGIGGVHEADQ